MAGPCACRSPHWNPLSAGKDKLAGAAQRAPINGSKISTHTPAISFVPNTTVAIAPIASLSSDNELFKQFIKAYLEPQVLGQIVPEIDSKPCKQSFKTRFPDLYYDNLHIDYYQFYQQCKNYFGTVGTKRLNKILFAASFLHELVSQQ